MIPWIGVGWGTQGAPEWTKLWIGGILILDTAAGLSQKTSMGMFGEAMLRAGETYDLRLECAYAGHAVAKLCWDTSALDRRVIPRAFLHPVRGPNRDVQAPAEMRPEVIADFGFEETDGELSRSLVGVEIFGRLTGNARRVAGKTRMAVEFEAKGEFAPSLFTIDEELRLPDRDYTVAFCFKTPPRDDASARPNAIRNTTTPGVPTSFHLTRAKCASHITIERACRQVFRQVIRRPCCGR